MSLLQIPNIYPPAWGAVSSAEFFPWHRYAHLPHSSQALAVDVFGTLMMLDQEQRDAIMTNFAASIGIPAKGPWSADLEWLDDSNRLKEKRRTQVDVLVRGSESIICVECKFTESAGGACSQTQPLSQGRYKRMAQCNGRYSNQINPVNGRRAKCSLTGKGILYWEIVPDLFKYSAERDYQPCPFAGAEFQWMRNIVFSSVIAKDEGLRSAFVLMYADSPAFHIPKYLQNQAWRDFLSTVKTEAIAVKAVSFQSFIKAAEESLNKAGNSSRTWCGLSKWVNNKIKSAENRG